MVITEITFFVDVTLCNIVSYLLCAAEVLFDDIKSSLNEYIQAAEIYAKVMAARSISSI